MDFRDLSRVVTSRWRLVVPVFLIVFATTVVLTSAQTPRYRSSTTYAVRPTIVNAADLLGALGIVSRQSEIASTYAEIAASQEIRRRAVAATGLSGSDLRNTDVSTRLIPGTTLLEIRTLAPDPETARRFAEAIGEATTAFVEGLYGNVVALYLLDEPQASDRPAEPNVQLYIALGAVAGLTLALGAAFALEMLRGARIPRGSVGTMDDSGAVGEAYFMERLADEMDRSRRSHRPFSLGLLDADGGNVMQRLTHSAQSDALRRITSIITEHLSRGELIGRIGPRVFAILLPERDSGESLAVIRFLGGRARIETIDAGPNGSPFVLEPTVAVVTYLDADLDVQGLLVAASEALDRARAIQGDPASGWRGQAAISLSPRAPTESLWAFPPHVTHVAGSQRPTS